MAMTLLGWYWQFNLLLALAFGVWLLVGVIARWPGLALGGGAQLDWARRVMIGVPVLMLVVAGLRFLLPSTATAWSRGLIDGWTVFAGMQNAAVQTSTAVFGQGWQQLVVAALVAGWCLQIVLLVRRWLHLRRIVNAATPWKHFSGVRLRISDEISIPFATAAVGGATIVMPAALVQQPQYWRLSLRHELQHVRNGDLPWVLMLEVLRACCFWNPLALLWQRELETLHELACDEALVVGMRVDSQTYGNCLLDIAQAQNEPGWLGAAAMVCWQRWFNYNPGPLNNGLLRRRIMRINKMQQDSRSRVKSALYGLLVASGLLGSSLLVVAAEAQNDGVAAADIVPLTRVNPDYPAAALEQKLEGWVQLRFDLDAAGTVQNATVVASCAGAELASCKEGDPMFAESAHRAVQGWTYAPNVSPRIGVETVIRFQLTK